MLYGHSTQQQRTQNLRYTFSKDTLLAGQEGPAFPKLKGSVQRAGNTTGNKGQATKLMSKHTCLTIYCSYFSSMPTDQCQQILNLYLRYINNSELQQEACY